MKQITNRFSISIIALIVGIGIISACSSSKNSSGNSTGTASNGGTKQGEAAGNNPSNVQETPKTTTAKESDIISGFKNGQDYKTNVRPKLTKDGWQPSRSEDGEESCQSSGMKICDEYPELDAGPAAGMGNIVFRWKKGDKVLLIHTVDDPPIYTEYEFEKQSKLSNPSEFAGKYELSVVGISGDHTLELKSNNTATLKILEEDGTSTGTGSWSWDETKKLLTVTLSVKVEIAGTDETEKQPKPTKVVFQFTREGKNLKIVNQTLAPDVSYSGNLFKKV